MLTDKDPTVLVEDNPDKAYLVSITTDPTDVVAVTPTGATDGLDVINGSPTADVKGNPDKLTGVTAVVVGAPKVDIADKPDNAYLVSITTEPTLDVAD